MNALVVDFELARVRTPLDTFEPVALGDVVDRAVAGKYGVLAARFHIAGKRGAFSGTVELSSPLGGRHRAREDPNRYVPVHRPGADPLRQTVDPLGEDLHVPEGAHRHDGQHDKRLLRDLLVDVLHDRPLSPGAQ
ncbi:hypothetical protein ACWGQ9_22680 [Streptomyces parvus]